MEIIKEGGQKKTKPISRTLPGNPKSEYLNPKRLDGCVLKKQTQFSESRIFISIYMKADYEYFIAVWKEKQSQTKPI
jgi:hypothetical protein